MKTFKFVLYWTTSIIVVLFGITLIWAGTSIFIISKGLSETDKYNFSLNTTCSDDECRRKLNGRYLMVKWRVVYQIH